MAFRIFAAVEDSSAADSIRAMIAETDDFELVAETDRVEDAFVGCSRHRVDAVLLNAAAPNRVGDECRRIVAYHPELAIVLATDRSDNGYVAMALRAGARGVIELPTSLDELRSELGAACAWSTRMAGRRTHTVAGAGDGVSECVVVAFAGAKGGVGTTTIATQLATLLARSDADSSVCLVDLDLQTGDVGTFLDIAHHRHIGDLVDVAGDIAHRQLEETLYCHGDGFHVLLGPDEGEFAEDVDAACARAVLEALSNAFDHVIVDAGAVMTSASTMAVEIADIAVVVANPDVPSMRGANRILDLWARLRARPDGRTSTLVNRVDKSSDVQPELVGRIVRAELIATTIPNDPGGLWPATNSGSARRADGSIAQRAIARMADELSLTSTPASPARRR